MNGMLQGVLVSVAMVMAAAASAAPLGSGEFSVKESLKVPKCGGASGAISIDLALNANGSWIALTEGQTYTGTFTDAGKVANLAFDTPSNAAIRDVIEIDASDLCEVLVDLTSMTISSFTLKFNKSGTSAKLKLQGTASGTSEAGSGTAKYSLKGSGSWSSAL